MTQQRYAHLMKSNKNIPAESTFLLQTPPVVLKI